MDPLSRLRPEVLSTTLSWPADIFGNTHALKPIKTVVVNIVETIASLLLDNDVVGNELENFAFEYAQEFNSNNERVYSNVTKSLI